MKRKKINWDHVPWTPFEPATLPPHDRANDHPVAVFLNSRYQVNVYTEFNQAPFGRVVWLSIKTRDKQARHDWRDMQRIKNEIVGEQYDAVEIYPAEDKLVDTANQFHLWVFLDYLLPFGFHTRIVSSGNWKNSVQRPWPKGEEPMDAISGEEYGAALDRMISGQKPGA